MKSNFFVIGFIIFSLINFSTNSKTTISGGVINTQDNTEGLSEEFDYFYESYNLKPPINVQIETSHLENINLIK